VQLRAASITTNPRIALCTQWFSRGEDTPPRAPTATGRIGQETPTGGAASR
jgi:putative component of membrane protein insertase Oxa1/YidC/SpoIIIJ protein YidD